MSIKLKTGNYIRLSEVPDEDTYQKVKQKFVEAGCGWGDLEESLRGALGGGVKYAGYCKHDGYYLTWNFDNNIYNEVGGFADESYYVPVSTLLQPSSPEEKISKLLTEDVTFSHDFLVDLLKVYIYKGYLNDVSLVMPNELGDFHIDLVTDLQLNTATIYVNCESDYEELVEEYSITIPLPELMEE